MSLKRSNLKLIQLISYKTSEKIEPHGGKFGKSCKGRFLQVVVRPLGKGVILTEESLMQRTLSVVNSRPYGSIILLMKTLF